MTVQLTLDSEPAREVQTEFEARAVDNLLALLRRQARNLMDAHDRLVVGRDVLGLVPDELWDATLSDVEHFAGKLSEAVDGEPPVTADVSLPDPTVNSLGAFSAPRFSGAAETQREAALSVYFKTGSDRLRALRLIAATGEHGACDFEIEALLGLPHQTASARRNDLMRMGWITDSGQRRRTPSGRNAAAWVLTRAGRLAFPNITEKEAA